jgi:hypothetical protein
MQNINILPLFSQPVFQSVLELNNEENNKLKNIFLNQVYEKVNTSIVAMSVSCNKKILNDMLFIKNKIKDQFNFIIKNILKIDNEFAMTSSWLTKSEKNQVSEFHVHTNSVFSGVYYPNFNEEISEIVFQKSMFPEISLKINEFNQYNFNQCFIKPEKNFLIFFPSNLNHKVGINLTDSSRYSLAFNFFPTGNLGMNDSSMEIKTFE